jgi:hypothetical protein
MRRMSASACSADAPAPRAVRPRASARPLARGLAAAVGLALALAGCGRETGEPAFAFIRGVTQDATSGAPLPNVVVVARDSAGERARTVTSSAGTFLLEDLQAGLALTLVATTPNYEAASAQLTTVEGENDATLALRRARVCRPGEKRCTVAPAAAAVLTCNDEGTAYASAACGAREICDVTRAACAEPSVVRLNVGGTGTGLVRSSPAGLSCPPACEYDFGAGVMVTLTATATGESRFGAWGGVCMSAGSASECRLTTAGNQLASARFDTTEPGVSVVKEGTGQGTVTSDPPGIDCGSDCGERFASGLTVRLAATPRSGDTFEGWSRGCDSVTGNRCVVAVSASRAVVARFEAGYLSPLPADGACRWLFRFEGPDRLTSACGGGMVATSSGTVGYESSRRAQLGSALALDGLGFVDLGRPPLLTTRSRLELSVLRTEADPGRQVLLSDRVDGSTTSPGLDLLVDPEGRVVVVTADGSGATTRLETNPGVVTPGTWVYLSLAFDPATGLRLSSDGELRAEVEDPIAYAPSGLGAWVGARRDQAPSFRGRIDELKLGTR